MKNKMFSGYRDIFLFTMKQGMGGRYITITLILALALFAGGFGANIIMAMSQKKNDNISPIEKVYVLDESGIGAIDWADTQLDKKQFPDVTFEESSAGIKELGLQMKDEEVKNVIVRLTKEKEQYTINLYIPNGSDIEKDDCDNLATAIKSVIRDGLISESGIDADKISYVISGMNVEFCTVGEDAKSDNVRMLTTIFPTIFMLGIYFMVIIYGQSMGQIVSIEKSSKLMETLLVMTRPYGLIFGKILATSFSAILQILLWMLSGVVGFIVGDGFARNAVYSGFKNGVLIMLKSLASEDGIKAFTPQAIVLALITVCLAFVFYCMLAGAIASFASKAEELGTVMMFYNMFIILGFLGSYVIPTATGSGWVKVLVRLIPVSSAFLLPGEIIVGTVEVTQAILYIIVLVAWIILTAIFAGKIYKDQVFYRGKSLKDILPWAKKQDEEEDEEQWQLLHDEAGRPLEKSQKIGYFFVAVSPFAIFLVIQVLGSLVVTNIMTRFGLRGIETAAWETKDFADFYHKIESTLNPATMMSCHIFIIATFGLWMYFVRRGMDRKNIFHIKSLAEKKLPVILGVCLVCGIGLCLLANGVVAVEQVVVPSVVEDYLEMAQNTGMGVSPFAIFAAVCLAPVGEEFLCRGICLHYGRKALNKFWYANILQALMFGLLHLNWVQGVYAFVIGLVLGILVERYDSLLPAMVVHFIVNFSSTTWTKVVLKNLDVSMVTGALLVLIPGAIVITALYFSREKA